MVVLFCNYTLDTGKFRILKHHGRCLPKEGEYVTVLSSTVCLYSAIFVS